MPCFVNRPYSKTFGVVVLALLCCLVGSSPLTDAAVKKRGQVATRCGIMVTVPAGWIVGATEPGFGLDSSCATGLKPRNWDERVARSQYQMPEFAVFIEAFGGSLTSACKETFICKDSLGTWWIEGRWGARDSGHSISSQSWVGVRGVSETGAYSKDGGYYQHPAKAFVALLDNRRGRMALVVADNEMRDDSIFDQIVGSIRFR